MHGGAQGVGCTVKHGTPGDTPPTPNYSGELKFAATIFLSVHVTAVFGFRPELNPPLRLSA